MLERAGAFIVDVVAACCDFMRCGIETRRIRLMWCDVVRSVAVIVVCACLIYVVRQVSGGILNDVLKRQAGDDSFQKVGKTYNIM